jgi:hypothetical protein
MKPILLYRIAAVLLVLFALGHTLGFLKFQAPTAEGKAVWEAMNSVHFQIGGSSFSYGGFYIGFGLFVTAYLLFSAALAWQLGTLSLNHPEYIGPIGWSFFLVQIASLVLSWIYFSLPPALFSALIAACLGWASWLVRRPVR